VRITGGSARGLLLTAPKHAALRPTSDKVRNAIFQLVGALVEEARVLDLYAGTGALGIEALSRGAAFAEFVEQDARLCQAIRGNLERVGFAELGRVHRAKVETAVAVLEGPFRLALMDPPYALAGVPAVVARLTRPGLLERDALVVWEHSSRDKIEEYYGALSMKTQRKYGDTSVSLFVMQATEGEG